MLRLHKITGSSLEPEFLPGEFVVIARFPFFRTRPGQVIVFEQPGYGLLIKRVQRVEQSGRKAWVAGSHPDSIDSRRFGPVDRGQILGRVVWHIRLPARRAGG